MGHKGYFGVVKVQSGRYGGYASHNVVVALGHGLVFRGCADLEVVAHSVLGCGLYCPARRGV